MKEKILHPVSGFWVIALIAICIGGGIYGAVQENVALPVILFVAAFILSTSISVVQPNKSVVVTFLANMWVRLPPAGCSRSFRSASVRRYPCGSATSTA